MDYTIREGQEMTSPCEIRGNKNLGAYISYKKLL